GLTMVIALPVAADAGARRDAEGAAARSDTTPEAPRDAEAAASTGDTTPDAPRDAEAAASLPRTETR
ncbi:hypothetical protein, partial [Enterococcus faecium]